MILIGRALSPFVRRVQVTLNLLGLACEFKPYGVVTHGAEIARYNPLRRVPSLVLDNDEVLIDSSAILDYLDELVGPEKALTPPSGLEKRKALKLTALAVGAAEKAIAAFYEKARRPDDKVWDEWADKCADQALSGLRALEDMAPEDGGWFGGEKISQADITTAVVIEFMGVELPDLIGEDDIPRLKALVARFNELEAFSSTHPANQ